MQPLRVTVFGGSSPRPGQPAYEQAYQLGQLLGQAGYTVLTGGYMGTMEAVSRGAAETGAHVIGVTCEEIENWRETGPNAWVKEVRRVPTLRDRIQALIEGSEAALALPGGPGTLTEISLTWNQLVIQAISARPLILIGSGWRLTFETMFQTLGSYFPDSHRHWLLFAKDGTEALQLLSSYNFH